MMLRLSSTASRTNGERLLNEGGCLAHASACLEVAAVGSCMCACVHVCGHCCCRLLPTAPTWHAPAVGVLMRWLQPTCSGCCRSLVVVRMRTRMHQKHGYYVCIVFAQHPRHICSMRSAGRHVCCWWCCWCCWPPIDFSRCMRCTLCTGVAESGPVMLLNGL